MMGRLNQIRRPRPQPVWKTICRLFAALLLGAACGAIAKALDWQGGTLGDVFSQMSVWVLLGALIAVPSGSPLRAAAYLPVFCIGMLSAYYIMAHFAQSPWSPVMAWGWAAFSLLSPLFGAAAWYAAGKGRFAALLAAGILLAAAAVEIVLFDRLRISDFLCLLGLVLLFFRKGKFSRN